MEAKFWLDKWNADQIGFHEIAPHPLLVAHWSKLHLATTERVFVPLCGKSNDLLWLRARGHEVIGVELSEIAVRDFFGDSSIDPEITTRGELQRFSTPGITIYCGDIFALNAHELGQISAIYDRAALIALPPPMRARYAPHLTSLSSATTQMLTITVAYDQKTINPPPFVVANDEIEQLFAADWALNPIATVSAEVKGQPASETVFRFARKTQS
jgi:thiopurine S-methyltransferase